MLKAAIDNPASNLIVNVKPLPADASSYYWNAQNAPIEITATGKRIPDWQLDHDVANQPVTSREEVYKGVVSPTEEKITFIPYGCTTLRVVAFPVVP